MSRHIRRYRPGRPWPTLRAMRPFQWRGFLVTIYNNRIYGFRYEYGLKPLGPTMLKLSTTKGHQVRKYGKRARQLHDPSSTLTYKVAVEYAKIRANEVRSPFWTRKPYDRLA